MRATTFIALFCTCGDALKMAQTGPLDPTANEYDDAYKYGNMMLSLWYYNWGKLEKSGFKKLYEFEDPAISTVVLFKDENDGCVLATSGFRNDADQTIQGLAGFVAGTSDMCGYKMNTWTRNNFKQMFGSPTFAQVNDYLSSGKCSSTTVVGHSVGGALSNVMAVCANNGMLGKELGIESNFHIDKIYTFGAWAVSETTMTNAKSESGCFDGIRFYTASGEGKDKKYDFMSTVGQSKHLLNPKMGTIGLLKEDKSGHHEGYDCNDESASIAPANGLQANPLDMVFNGEKVLHDLHRMQVYLPALKQFTTFAL